MRYLVNLPLGGAVLLGWIIIQHGVLSPMPRGGEAAIGATILIVLTGLLALVLLTLAVVGSAMTGGFDWPPVAGGGARITLLLSASARSS